MEKPEHFRNRRNLAQKCRADATVTSGIEAEIEECHRLSAVKRSREILFFVALYLTGGITAAFAGDHRLWTLAGIVLMGVALNSLGILIHEGLHGLLARNEAINHLLSFLCGLPLLISATAYQATHNDHHFEFGRKLDYGTYRQHLDKKGFVWVAYYAQLLFGSVIYVLFIPILALKTASRRARCFLALEYSIILGAGILLFRYLPLESILVYWIYPSLVLMLLSNIRGLASHALGDLDDIYLSSRTVKTSPVIAFLFLHENYHLEHHLFPRVPSYNLKKIHSLVWHRLPRGLYSRSYGEFLFCFLKASFSLDLSPHGLVYPARSRQAE